VCLSAQHMSGWVCEHLCAVHVFRSRTAGAVKGTQVETLTWLSVSQMAAYSRACLRIHYIGPAASFQVPGDTHPELEIRARTFSLLLPASAARDPGGD